MFILKPLNASHLCHNNAMSLYNVKENIDIQVIHLVN